MPQIFCGAFERFASLRQFSAASTPAIYSADSVKNCAASPSSSSCEFVLRRTPFLSRPIWVEGLFAAADAVDEKETVFRPLYKEQ